MDTQEAIISRRSARSYAKGPVSDEALEKILQAAYAAPVAGGKHGALHLTVVQKPSALAAVAAAIKGAMNLATDPLYGAPVLIIVSGSAALPAEALYATAGCLLENMQLAATALGLGSCIIWGAGFALADDAGKAKLGGELSFAEGFRPLAGVVVGSREQPPAAREPKETYQTAWVR